MTKANGMVKSTTRWWDLPSILLLIILLTTTYSRLVTTEWTEHLNYIRPILYLGIAAGLALGFSRFSPRWAIFFGVAYGLFTIPWRLGVLMGEGVLWSERLLSLGGRLGSIFAQLFRQQAVTDNLLFLSLMGILFWVLGIYSSYQLVRYAHPWKVLLPSGIALVVIHRYDQLLTGRLWYLVVYLFFALILLARIVFLQQLSRWKETKTYTPPYLGLDFVRITLVITGVLLVFAWAAPGLAETLTPAREIWSHATSPFNRIRNTLDNAFASLRSTVGIVSDYYGPTLTLGRGQPLSDSLLLNVTVPSEIPNGVRYYWRARVYDEYDYGWKSTLITTETVDPDNFNFQYPDMADNAPDEYSFAFTIGAPLSTLLAPHQTTWVSRPAKLELTYNPDDTVDLAMIRAAPPLRAGESYQVRASFSAPSIADLRAAGSDYPEWILNRYLQLPDSISERTSELARHLAEGRETPYDIVIAVTNYLRTNIAYEETIPAIPANQEPIDWFLFDYRRGFCNYYASAEVILLRSLGIPARLAAGYARGEMRDIPNVYFVRQRDSHAWPEVYFPGIGWVEFEPTVSQPAIIRPLGESLDRNLSSLNQNLPDDLNPEDRLGDRLGGEEEGAGDISLEDTIRSQIVLYASLMLSVALLVLLILFATRRGYHKKLTVIPIILEAGFQKIGFKPPAFLHHWAAFNRLSPLARAYSQINLALNRLGEKPSIDATPAERAVGLANTLPPATEPAKILVSEYQAATYSQNYEPDLESAHVAGKTIRRLSILAQFQKFISKFQESRKEYTPLP